ncbi:MAG: hypothetical protein JSR24_24170, partial [Proteobacteria bacterium]|nr:hypothetical protein [Pseudomonadota bacterium]
MKLSRRSRREWRTFLWVMVVSEIVSVWFRIKVAPSGEPMLRSGVHGAITCLMIATPILLLQLRGQRLGVMRRMQRAPLAVYFVFRVLLYFAVIVVGLLLARLILSHDVVRYVQADPVFRQALLFSIGMSVIGNLFFEFSQLLG